MTDILTRTFVVGGTIIGVGVCVLCALAFLGACRAFIHAETESETIKHGVAAAKYFCLTALLSGLLIAILTA